MPAGLGPFPYTRVQSELADQEDFALCLDDRTRPCGTSSIWKQSLTDKLAGQPFEIFAAIVRFNSEQNDQSKTD